MQNPISPSSVPSEVPTHGTCTPALAPVRDRFAELLAQPGELGAACAIFLDGRPVLDLWGGYADLERARPWAEDTMAVVFSAIKGPAALIAHSLVAQGVLDFEAPVARYWPQFAQNGKAGLLVKHVLTHQAGLSAFAEDIDESLLADWPRAIGMLEAQAPFWPPGEALGYHPITFGWLFGELVFRVTGRRTGELLREICAPLDADVYLGLPESLEPRVATLKAQKIPLGEAPPKGSEALYQALMDGQSLTHKSFGPALVIVSARRCNTREVHALDHPAFSGIAGARGLARLYAALAGDGSLGGVRVLPDAARKALWTPVARGFDRVACIPTCYAMGFLIGEGDKRFAEGEKVFGFMGAGGSLAFADAERRLSFAWITNRMGAGIMLDERPRALIQETYRCLGAS